jgi:hypothetical protein
MIELFLYCNNLFNNLKIDELFILFMVAITIPVIIGKLVGVWCDFLERIF